jgi:CBS domain containing-hemolysin-like protein
MIHLLEEGLWEADARAELDEISRDIDARLVAEEDEVDTLGGLTFLLAGRILAPGESVQHPSGWRIICVEADARRMIKLRLEAPEIGAG